MILFSFHFSAVINSTYQPNEDANGSAEEDILYRSDASFGAKLDTSEPHSNHINSNVNKTNSNNSLNTNKSNKKKTNNENSNHNRYQNAVNKSSVKNRLNNSGGSSGGIHAVNSELETNERSRSNGDEVIASKIDDDDDHKTNVNSNDLDADSDLHADDDDVNDDADDANGNDDNDDVNYDGDKISASESIVIKLGASKAASVVSTNLKPKPKTPLPSSRATTTAAPAVTSSMVNNFNDDYYSKDDMSVYDDVNNNRLNLRNANGHVNAYEQRNIYVANELSDGVSNTNDSVKSYIHIEVYKGNLDDLTTLRTTMAATATTTTMTAAASSTTMATAKLNATFEP